MLIPFEPSWAFWGPEATSLYKSASSAIGPSLCKRWPNLQLNFEGVRASTYQSWDYRDFPKANLVSCKVAAWERSELPMIRELLFERPRLQELHLVHGKSAAVPWEKQKIVVHQDQTLQQLPALKTLIIDGYDWNHSP